VDQNQGHLSFETVWA